MVEEEKTMKLTKTEMAIRRNFPGPHNAGIRESLRTARTKGAITLMAQGMGLTYRGRAGIEEVKATLPASSYIDPYDNPKSNTRRRLMAKKKWGKIGAPKSATRRAWLKKIAKRRR